MELAIARQIIDTLAQGIHPVTGDAMPEDSPYNHPAVIRALFAVSRALEAQDDDESMRARRPRRPLPLNSGKPWMHQEDRALEIGFDAGIAVEQLAQELGRSVYGIEQRLIKLGKLAARKPGDPK